MQAAPATLFGGQQLTKQPPRLLLAGLASTHGDMLTAVDPWL